MTPFDSARGARRPAHTRSLDAIIFDFDGVIADTERLHLRAYQETLAPRGIELTERTYFGQLVGYDDRGALQRLGALCGLNWDERTLAQLVAEKTVRYEDLAAEGEMLYPGAAAFILAAAARVPIAISSGALTNEIVEILERAGLRELFSAVVGADQTARSKPSPEPYREAFARLQESSGRALDPTRTVAIEDTRAGLLSAQGAGLRLVAVTNTYAAVEFSRLAELIVSGLDELTLEALDELCEGIPT